MRATRRACVLGACLALLGSCAAADARVSLERVQLVAPSVQIPLLERLGIDVTEDVTQRSAVVVVGGAGRAVLAANGFAATVLDSDVLGSARRARAADARATRSALPSGRSTYRTLADYMSDIDALVGAHPGLVRKVVLPRKSVEGRSIVGVEIAKDVGRVDDGRPVFLVFGLHHAREWSSGEIPIEFAQDIAASQSDARVAALLRGLRIIVVPVVNPDGFNESRSGAVLLKRRNCRAVGADDPASSCALKRGVDLNRDYGANWGGAGASESPDDDTYRGAGPWSEPEAQAVHELSQHLQVTGVQSFHNFGGTVLRPPGWVSAVVPDEAALKRLGDQMAADTGYVSEPANALGLITGATEDWNYLAQGAFGYTIEVGGTSFQDPYATAVVDQYRGTGGRGGLRAALLSAAEEAMDPTEHAVIAGHAPAGSVLHVRRDFETATSQPFSVPDFVDSALVVGPGGAFNWNVGPSTRPLVHGARGSEAWTLTCSPPHGASVVKQVTVWRGQVAFVDPCGGGPPKVATRLSLSVHVDPRWARILRSEHALRMVVRCGLRCTLEARLTLGHALLGQRVSSVRAEKSTVVRVKIGPKALARIRRATHPHLHLSIKAVAVDGPIRHLHRTLTL